MYFFYPDQTVEYKEGSVVTPTMCELRPVGTLVYRPEYNDPYRFMMIVAKDGYYGSPLHSTTEEFLCNWIKAYLLLL